MPGAHPKIAFEILREEGPRELSRLSHRFFRFHIVDKPKLWFKYGEIRPKPREILYVDPTEIDYRIGKKHIPDDAPPYGIIDGEWDLNKSHWQAGFFYGLIERFEEGKKWEDTVYYQTGMELLESGETFGPVSNSQTVRGFKRYLSSLDELYEDITQNGYDMSSVLKVHVGRDGELIVKHGNHRLTIARITDVDEVPVRIQYRHKKWQELRAEIFDTGFPANHEELRDHPDLRETFQ
ncbi:ParB-like nuclease domain containing protein [Halalkaliarchaeum sp. AArc-CO]|uniref:hypothetical protein n=1 Tax=unclassified Halalkaliarchaeum TaxID=2678344 RepID=UPI00217E6BF0|nr:MULTISPECIES: hypothetical protein [unclassified Halalkaliarchaeum]MDR5672229.1 hypothetical protein [Halalkaliarchaeum sp. AArc-GB]UWG50162.1 ParB-like nuclease domain containing protein [Halalkaliarchaeum sp. AArc-CO]